MKECGKMELNKEEALKKNLMEKLLMNFGNMEKNGDHKKDIKLV